MSFVYAKKISNTILVLGDTKITFDKTQGRTLWANEKTRDDVNKYGIVKNFILADIVCIGFAGDSKLANVFLLRAVKNNFQFPELIELAFELHNKDNEPKIDFLLCYCDDEIQKIIQIKNKEKLEVNHAWIGSQMAFNCFQQKYISNDYKTDELYGDTINYRVCENNDYDEEVEKVFDAFYYTIYRCGDDTVGGLAIRVLFDNKENAFIYKGYVKKTSYRKMTKLADMMTNTQSGGDFTIIQYTSKYLVGVFIMHGNIGLTFRNVRSCDKDYNNEASNMLLTANSFKILQLDYYIQGESLGLKAPMWVDIYPYNYNEIFKRIEHYKDKPEILICYIDKLIQIISMFSEHIDDLDYLNRLKARTIKEIEGLYE